MKKYIKIIVSLVVIVVIAYFYSFVDKKQPIYNKRVDNGNYINTSIVSRCEQHFISKENSIDGISMKLTTTGDLENIDCTVNIYDTNQQKLATVTKQASSLVSGKFNTFKFDTLKETKNKEYIVELVSNNANINESKGILVSYENTGESSFVVNDTTIEGTTIIRTVTHRFDVETMFVFLLFVGYVYAFMKVLYKLFK